MRWPLVHWKILSVESCMQMGHCSASTCWARASHAGHSVSDNARQLACSDEGSPHARLAMAGRPRMRQPRWSACLTHSASRLVFLATQTSYGLTA